MNDGSSWLLPSPSLLYITTQLFVPALISNGLNVVLVRGNNYLSLSSGVWKNLITGYKTVRALVWSISILGAATPLTPLTSNSQYQCHYCKYLACEVYWILSYRNIQGIHKLIYFLEIPQFWSFVAAIGELWRNVPIKSRTISQNQSTENNSSVTAGEYGKHYKYTYRLQIAGI